MARRYRLGRRQASVDRTATSILEAARNLLVARPAPEVSLAEVARRAGVSRITVYNRFGSRERLLQHIAEAAGPPERPADAGLDPREALREHLAASSARWSSSTALHRHLHSQVAETETDRVLAERLAAADHLRPGCSIREAEDVIGALSSFELFDRLYKEGRRSTAAVTEILLRLASTIVVPAYHV